MSSIQCNKIVKSTFAKCFWRETYHCGKKSKTGLKKRDFWTILVIVFTLRGLHVYWHEHTISNTLLPPITPTDKQILAANTLVISTSLKETKTNSTFKLGKTLFPSRVTCLAQGHYYDPGEPRIRFWENGQMSKSDKTKITLWYLASSSKGGEVPRVERL